MDLSFWFHFRIFDKMTNNMSVFQLLFSMQTCGDKWRIMLIFILRVFSSTVLRFDYRHLHLEAVSRKNSLQNKL